MSRKKSGARQHAVQAIYQWQMTGQDVREIRGQFLSEQDKSEFDAAYFDRLVQGVPSHLDELDKGLGTCLDRSIESVDPV